MLHPSASSAAPPIRSPPPKIFTRLHPGGSFQRNSPARHAPTKAPTGTPRAMTMLQLTRVGNPTIAYVRRCPVLAANVIPTGRSPKVEAHQPTVIMTPTAPPVSGQRHL